jgi:hypothetical protein
MDFIKTAQPQWKNLNSSDTARLDEFFDHMGSDTQAFLARGRLYLGYGKRLGWPDHRQPLNLGDSLLGEGGRRFGPGHFLGIPHRLQKGF